MNEDEFRAAMARASRANDILHVADDEAFGVAVGYDSARGVIILHGNHEMPMAGARLIGQFA